MIDLEKEREAFESGWKKLGGHLLYVEWTTDKLYSLSENAIALNKGDAITLLNTINTALGLWIIQAKSKQIEIDSLKSTNFSLEEINSDLSESVKLLKAEIDSLKEKLAKVESGEFVLVPTSKVKYFSNDGENYEIHNTIEEAKKEAESAIEYFSEQLADQQLNPECDGNFHQVGYGIVLGWSGYSVDHVVTQEDVDKGDYSYEAGTQIMSLFLVEPQED